MKAYDVVVIGAGSVGTPLTMSLAERGLFVGPSSGAYVHAALDLAAGSRFRTMVTVLSDTGERYGSTGMWGTSSDPTFGDHRPGTTHKTD